MKHTTSHKVTRTLSTLLTLTLVAHIAGGGGGGVNPSPTAHAEYNETNNEWNDINALEPITAEDFNAVATKAAQAQDTATTADTKADAAQATASAALPADDFTKEAIENFGFSASATDWSELTGIPDDFADGIDNNDAKLTEAEVDAYTANNGYLTTETDPTVNAAAKADLSTCAAGDVLLFGSSGWECSTNVSGTGKWSDGTTSGDIVYTGGNVGIGTDEPKSSLHISGVTDGRVLITNDSTGNTASDGTVFITEDDGEFHFLNRENTDIKISTNATERLRINSSGNVGIGTSSPNAKLYVVGNNDDAGVATTKAELGERSVFTIAPDTSVGSTNMNFGLVGGGDTVGIQTTNSGAAADWNIALNPFGGKVGIGTTDPGAKLEVASTNSSQLTLRNTDTTNGTAGYGNLWADNNGLWLQGHGDTSGQSIILNPNGGNVGIATQSPDAKLDVEGSLQADTFTGEASIYTHAQKITTSGAVDVEHYFVERSNGADYRSVAFVNETSGTVDIHYFDYSYAGLTVGEFQPETTITGFNSPNDAESFEYNDTTYLVVGDDSTEVKTYAWDATNQEFNLLSGDEIGVTGHIDTEVFSQDSRQIIALAQSSGIKLYEWDGSNFNNIQTISLADARHLYFFEADLNADDATEAYLAAAAGDNVLLYQWQNGQNFDPLTLAHTLEAPSAQNAHYFVVDDRQFLMVPSDGDDIDSPLYEWNGTEFEVAQTLNTYSGSVAATNFELNGTQYLVLTAKGQSTNDYLLFYWYEDDQFNYRQMIIYDNTSGGLADIEFSGAANEDRLIFAQGTTSQVLRLQQYKNAYIDGNLQVVGQDIIMAVLDTQDNTDSISYDDTDNVYSFHADQEHRPGWDSPGAAISAKNGYFGGRYVGSANTSGNYYLGNFDWTDYVGNHSNYNYSEEHQGVIISNSMNVFFGNRTPIDPEATYRIRVRAKKLSGDGTFYAGVQTLDEHFVELRTDGASSYNYGVASAQVINVGETKTFEGFFKGYGVVDAADHNKFDPGGKYFNAMIIANYQTTDSESETVIESIEIEKVDTIIADKDGNVGIGTTNPERKLLVKDDNPLPIQIEYDGTLGNGSSVGIAFLDNADGSSAVNSQIRAIRESDYESGLAFFTKNLTTGTQESFRVYGNGNAWLKGELTENSDSRYKKDIRTLPSALQNILSLRGVSYYWKDGSDTSQHIGVISQEVEKVYPQLVRTDEDGYKSVAYSHLVSPLIEAVKELHALYQGHANRLAALEAQNVQLQERDAALEAQNAELETQNAHQDERIAHQDELIVQLEVRLAALEAAQ